MEYKNNYRNLFIDIFSFVNKIFTVEDFMLKNIPEELNRYLYISCGIEITGRYINFNMNNLNIFIIKTDDNDNRVYSDVMMFQDIPTLIIIIPSFLEPGPEMINERSNMIEFIYNNIFNYLKDSFGEYKGSTYNIILSFAPYVLPILTEKYLSLEINLDFYYRYDEEINNIIRESLKYSIEDLFRYGALSAIVKQELKAKK